MENIPLSISIGFTATTIATFILFYRLLKKSNGFSHLANKISIGIIVWLAIQYSVATSGVYIKNIDATPPPFIFVFIPVLLLIVYIFNSKKGKDFIDSLPLLALTQLHIVRIPVELILYGLALYKTIPELMTFAGRNFDIIAGITAPFVALFGVKKHYLSKTFLLVWNYICLGLLLFIVVNAVLSAPFSFQQFAFNQPNIAVLYAPYIWLPAFIVPAVLFCHITAIRQLTIKK